MDNKTAKCFLVLTNKEQWTSYINKSFEFDFYHSWDYHVVNNHTGEPLLFVYEEGHDFIAIPFLKRAVPDSNLSDLTSAYGYLGPVSNKKMKDITSSMKLNFELAFKEFVKEHHVVSVFSRLHPFFQQNLLLSHLGGVQDNGKTIYMDFSVSLDEQRKRYHSRLLRQIRQLRKRSYIIKEATTDKEIASFTEIYQENMLRLAAAPNYYFSKAYFQKLIGNQSINCKLILIYEEEKIICGAIIGYSAGIIRNHLSATHKDHIKDSPSKLLTDEISVIGRNMGMQYFHLGGGLGGKDDSLFAFKSNFSKLVLDDHIWCYIADEKVYHSLVEQRDIHPNRRTFFPLYRS
ncbi:MAG TPA: hypothetical protein VL125_13005 [Pelobium sp.]|nr:hypothetical protein [Pelobium sp.]